MKCILKFRLPLILGVFASVLGVIPANAQWDPTGGPIAHDVVGQLAALDSQASCLAFWRGGFMQPGPFTDHRTRHWQGIARHPDPAARVMYVTLSQYGDSGQPGAIGAVLIDSADVHPGSARLRSNRLIADTELARSTPYRSDRVVWSYTTDGYVHPSGIQAAGRYLAVPLSGAYGGNLKKIVFFDISNPTAPVLVPKTFWNVAGDVAFLHLPDGRYLLYTGHKWYRTTGADLSTMDQIGGNDQPTEWPMTGLAAAEAYCKVRDSLAPLCLSHEAPAELPFALTASLPPVYPLTEQGGQLFKSFQSMSLVQDAGGIYLIGMFNRDGAAPVTRSNDVLAIYEVEIPEGEGGDLDISIRYVGAVDVDTAGDREIGGGDAWSGNFNAAGNVYVSPEGELLVYAIEHYDVGTDNFNVYDADIATKNYTPFAEFHHPRFTPPSPPPVTASTAYVALYSDTDFNGFRVELDFPEIAFETWNNFNDLPGPCRGTACDFNDELSSVVWSLPPGMTIRIHEDTGGGGLSMNLSGSGALENLHASHAFIADKASSLAVDYPGLWNLYVSRNDPRPGGTIEDFAPAKLLLDTFGGGEHTRIKLDSDEWSFTGIISEPVTLRSLGGPSTLGE